MSITKEDCQQYLKLLIEEARPKGMEGYSFATIQYMQFLLKNYNNLDQEMQAITDKLMDESLEVYDAALKGAPDTAETRQMKRLLRSIKDKRPTAKGLILGLERTLEEKEPIIEATKQIFEKQLQHLIDMLFDVIEAGLHGIPSFANVSLFLTSINELLCAFHLAQRNYASQAYTHIRSVLESINLIELICLEDKYAALWISNDERKKRRELSPAAVRKKLGQDKSAYSLLSELGAHPTFGYVQTQSAQKRKIVTDERPQITFWMGGTKWVPHIIWANSACIFVLNIAIAHLGLSFPSRVHKEDYPTILETCMNEFKNYHDNHLIKWQKEHGIDTKEVESLVSTVFSDYQKLKEQWLSK